ncbi:chemotaxis protein CheA [Ectothiorhodospiraceae bacterium WFHF3C12]|nr:chemotaxis protein CheA [Ectothiorhodospiraceae bacterium WFHF3C12]
MAIDTEDDIVQDFLVESKEILEGLGEQLVELERSPEDKDLLNSVFRGFHTIKGGAGFLSLDPLVVICHQTEDIFNLLRQGEKAMSADLMDTVLQALDVVNDMFGQLENGEDLVPASSELVARLKEHNQPDGEDGPAAADPPAEAPAAQAGSGDSTTPAGDGDISDQEFEQLLDALDEDKAAAGETEAVADADGDDEISDDEFEDLLDALHGKGQHQGAPAGEPASEPAGKQDAAPASDDGANGGDDLISEDEFDQLLDEIHGTGKAPSSAADGKQAEPSQPAPKKSEAKKAEPKKAESKAKAGSGKGSDKAKAGSGGGKADQAPAKPDASDADQATARAAAKGGDTTVRVDTAKLDDIMNLVGELVLVRNRLSTLRAELNDERVNQAVGELELVTSDLQSSVMKTRMQPIKKVFGRFPRLIRDLARGLKKEVNLETFGEETDLDKNLVEALADPLIHLVRNSVDHGIESPEERQKAGKSRAGTVLLAAEQEGDHILLTITDDGKGMDAAALRRKAVEKGVIDEEAARRLDDTDSFNLIFAPGFSTKEEISDVSGRGVGMDVVKNRISQLNGTIDIESKPGHGTTMRIKVPLTLAILPTLMVLINGRKFALPMSVVREIFELSASRTNVVDNRLVVMVRNKAMPLFFLERWLHRMGQPVSEKEVEAESEERQVVTVVLGHQAIGFVVDEVIGLEEVVIKPLGAMLHGLPGLAGSTITGDGKIALIVDIPSLIKRYGSRM